MTKQEALQKIKELEEFIKNEDENKVTEKDIGKLCEFWDGDEKPKFPIIRPLHSIKNNRFYVANYNGERSCCSDNCRKVEILEGYIPYFAATDWDVDEDEITISRNIHGITKPVKVKLILAE